MPDSGVRLHLHRLTIAHAMWKGHQRQRTPVAQSVTAKRIQVASASHRSPLHYAPVDPSSPAWNRLGCPRRAYPITAACNLETDPPSPSVVLLSADCLLVVRSCLCLSLSDFAAAVCWSHRLLPWLSADCAIRSLGSPFGRRLLRCPFRPFWL